MSSAPRHAVVIISLAAAIANCNALLGIDDRQAKPGPAGGNGGNASQGGGGTAGAGAAGGSGNGGAGAGVPTVLWARRVGGELVDVAYRVAVDSTGRVLVGGLFHSDTMDVGSGALDGSGDPADTGADGWALALDATTGATQWAVHVEDADPNVELAQRVWGVAFDGNDLPHLSGMFVGSARIGSATFTSAGLSDVFHVQLDAAGMAPQITAWGGAADSQWNRRIRFAPNGDLVIAGHYRGTLDFQGAPPLTPLTIYAESYAAQLGGGASWAVGLELGGLTVTADVAPMTQGAAVAGSIGVVPNTRAFISRIASPTDWTVRSLDLSADQAADAVAVSGSTVVVCGHFDKTLDLGGVMRTSGGLVDAFVAGLDADDGQVRWVTAFGGLASDSARALAVRANGNLVVAGYMGSELTIQGNVLPHQGSQDTFLVELDVQGDFVRAVALGGSGSLIPHDLAIDPDGNVLMVGQLTGSVTLGNVSLSSAVNSVDAMMVKIAW